MNETEEKLTNIYDSTDVELWRWTDNRAVVMVDKNLLVIRPHAWSEPSSWNFPHHETVERWGKIVPRAIGASDLGRLLVWASKRTPWSGCGPGDDEVMFTLSRGDDDIQRVCDAPFTRRIVREALQTFVEMDCRESASVTLELLEDERQLCSMLRITRGDVAIYAMGCRRDTACGADPMPVTWEAT